MILRLVLEVIYLGLGLSLLHAAFTTSKLSYLRIFPTWITLPFYWLIRLPPATRLTFVLAIVLRMEWQQPLWIWAVFNLLAILLTIGLAKQYVNKQDAPEKFSLGFAVLFLLFTALSRIFSTIGLSSVSLPSFLVYGMPYPIWMILDTAILTSCIQWKSRADKLRHS